MDCGLVQVIMVETEANDQAIELHVTEDIDTNDFVEATCESEKINDVDVNIECDEDEVSDESILGKVFDTADDAYNFYNDYSFLHGFGVRKNDIFKSLKTNEPFRKIYVCNKEGFKRSKKNDSSENETKRRRDVRTGCQARLRITIQKDGKWLVDLFNDTHNHELSMTPTKVMKHRSHNKFHRSMECKSLMVELGQSGLKPSMVKKAINAMKTSNEVDVTSKQCADVLSEQRKQHKGKEFYGLIKHFQDKTLVDNDQYFVVDLCDDGCPKNIFWADGRSRDAYTKFGDVVVFDVTYMTNKFKMPFAPFTGVNHHGQSILFGGALLENEKEETFEWLFEHFLKCMFNKYPKAIITDQDKAMGNSIKRVFPNTRHRFCEWHIKKHEPEHLRPYVSRYSDFQHSYREWVNSDTIEEFEATWEVIRCKYKPEIQYDKAVASRRAAEEDEDFKTMNSRPVLSSVHPIEAKAEWIEANNNLTHETLSKSIEESKYQVGRLDVDKTYWRIVTFRSLNQVSVTCSCAKYETHGILCKHSLYVMKKRHVQTLPGHYILPRWTLNARYKVGSVSIGLSDMNTENGFSTFTLWCVRSNFNKLIEQARDSPLEIQKLNTLLISLLEDQAVRKKSISFENTSQGSCMGISQVDMMPQLSVRDPLGPTTTKGRPKVASRIKSHLEAPKKRTCSYCQGLGHYASSCSKRKADESMHEKEK
ncbi:protein FAR1-RELATED SEQUENCE 5-like [Lactuca sativa]|uniref:protein FAR1-RELATED SEQUENCE 5-like n=1 Tax=Lactuca sativa TaxID=4236 RepID=UPI000CD8536E|nr:protein FAR1-RELATED SEQUENCE 5-like [Lactuca sativa]